MDEDALLAQALWAAEQADLYAFAYGSDGGHDSDSDYGGSSKRRKTQPKKGRSAPKARSSRKPPAAPRSNNNTSNNNNASSTNAAQPQQVADGEPSSVAAAAAQEAVAGAAQGQGSAAPAATAVLGAGPVDSAAGAAAAAASGGAAEAEQQLAGNAGLSSGGRRKRKDSGQKKERGKAWSDAEEASFLSGLEAHGRDWRAIAGGIRTRDARAVASHAQKHFIRLCLSGTPLPDRVAASGRGYTLSGNLLDPHSAAAAACGFSYTLLLERLQGEQLATALSGVQPLTESEASAAAAATAAGGLDAGGLRDQKAAAPGTSGPPPAKRQRRPSSSSSNNASKPSNTATPQQQQQEEQVVSEAEQVAAVLAAAAPPPLAPSEAAALAAAAAAAAGGTPVQQEGLQQQQQQEVAAACADPAVAQGPTTSTTSAEGGVAPQQTGPAAAAEAPEQQTDQAPTPAAAAAAAGPDGQTAYARSRPRRAAAGLRSGGQLGSTSESLELVAPHEFRGPQGSGVAGAQPYGVEVDLQAMLLMDVHVHLSGCEVIGLLGGSWDSSARLLRVTAAYPCRRVAGSDDATSVELDAASEVEARGAMGAAGQRCVGWYHSHPVFEPLPSRKDMDNQRNYQALTRDTCGTACGGGGIGGSGSNGGCGGSNAGSSSSGSGGVLEPFVGFILSPFDPALPLPHTSVKAFVVQQRGPHNTLVPFNIRYGLVNSSVPPGPSTREALTSLLRSCQHDMARTNFNAPWRPFTLLDASSSGGRLLGPPTTKLDKLLAGLRWWCTHVSDTHAVQAWLQGLCSSIQELWCVELRGVRDTATNNTAEEQQQQTGSGEAAPGQQQQQEQSPQEEQQTSHPLEQQQQQQQVEGLIQEQDAAHEEQRGEGEAQQRQCATSQEQQQPQEAKPSADTTGACA